MQKKMIMLGSLAAAILFLSGAPIATAADEPLQAPAKQILIGKKKPARFNHTTHLNLGLDCGICHHDKDHNPLTAEAMASITDASGLKCVSCHNSDHSNLKLQRAKDTFHARCKGCHKAGYQRKQGPTKCSGCHLKKPRRAMEGC